MCIRYKASLLYALLCLSVWRGQEFKLITRNIKQCQVKKNQKKKNTCNFLIGLTSIKSMLMSSYLQLSANYISEQTEVIVVPTYVI